MLCVYKELFETHDCVGKGGGVVFRGGAHPDLPKIWKLGSILLLKSRPKLYIQYQYSNDAYCVHTFNLIVLTF